MKRKVLSIVLVLSMLLGLVPSVSANTEIDTGSCGENVTWEFDGSIGMLSITGMGTMDDYDLGDSRPWDEYFYDIYNIFIDDGVTGIGDFAFSGCSNVRSVTIPASVNDIGDGAFIDMWDLISIRVSSANQNYSAAGKVLYNKDKTKIIMHCSKNDSVIIIPETVTEIAPYAFYDCSGLTGVFFGTGIDIIGENAFSNNATAAGLQVYYAGTEEEWNDIEIADGNSAIDYVEYESALCTSVALDRSEIEMETGDSFKLNATVMPENAAFKNVRWSTSDSNIAWVDSTGYVTAYNPGMATITVSTVDGGFNAECTVYVTAAGSCGANVKWKLSGDGTELTLTGTGATYEYSSYGMPWSNYSSGIRKIIVGEGITSLGTSLFSNCSNLTEVVLPSTLKEIKNLVFYKCSGLKKISLPEGLTTIGINSFAYCSSLEEIVLPKTLTSLGSYAFSNCSNLREITIPESITEIPEYLFNNCSSLRSVTMGTNVQKIGQRAFYCCYALENISLPDKITEIGDYGFYCCSNLKRIDFPEELTYLGTYAFNGCSSLKSVKIPEKLTSISDYAFNNCSSVEMLIIPDSVSSIGVNAFKYCSNLVTVIIGTGLKTVNSSAFLYCYDLSEVYYAGTEQQWGEINFTSNNTYLTRATITYGYTKVTEITITSEDEEIFVGDSTQLTAICLPEEAPLKTVFWSSSDPTIATVDEEGWVTAVSAGTVTITATSADGGVSGSCTIKTKNVPLTGMSIETESFELVKNRIQDVDIIFVPGNATNKNIKWTSTNEAVATINTDNQIVAVGEGQATITATAEEGGFTDSFTVTVIETIAGGELDGISWRIDYEGELSVSGVGAIPDFWVNYNEKDGTTANYASSYALSDSLTRMNVETLSAGNVAVGGGSASGGGGAGGGSSAESPDVSTNDAWDANLAPWYKYRDEIKRVNIGDGITKVGNYAFAYLDRVMSLEIADTVTIIGEYAFARGSYDYLRMPSQLETIGDHAFEGNGMLWEIKFNDGLKSIGDYAFAHCQNINTINLPDSLTSIGECAFYYTWLSRADIPQNVTSIGAGAFAQCANFMEFYVSRNNTSFVVENGVLYNTAKTTLIAYPQARASETTFTIPSTVTKIEGYAFCNSSLAEINIPDGVTEIGDSAFLSCDNLATINLPEGLTTLGEDVFAQCSCLTHITIPAGITEIPRGMFMSARELQHVNLHDGITKIGEMAFSQCESIREITLPANLTEIGRYAFQCCYQLEKIVFPAKLEKIGEYAFADISMLEKIEIPASVTEIGTNAFWSKSLTAISVSEDNEKYSSKDGVLFDKNKTSLISYPAAKETDVYVAPSTVTKVADRAFEGSRLFDVILPDAVTEIGRGAFSGCGQLQRITLPENLTTLGWGAFSNSALWEIAIPSGVTVIPDYAFSSCYNLNTVTVGANVEKISNWAFDNCNQLANLNLGSSVTEIGNGAFNYCTNIEIIRYAGTDEAWSDIEIEANNEWLLNRYIETNQEINSGIYLNTNILETSVGDEVTFEYTIDPENSETAEVLWYSSNPRIAEIWNEGTIYARLPGMTVIRIVDTQSGYTDYCIVNIKSTGELTETINWTLDENGVLTVSGSGEIPDYGADDSVTDDSETGATTTGMPPWAEMSDSIKAIVVENGITAIGNNAFSNLWEAKRVDIADSVTRIGDYAFQWCENLSDFVIPVNVSEIGDGAFNDLPSLSEFKVAVGNTSYAVSDGVLYSADKTELVAYPKGKENNVFKVPEGVTVIAPYVARNNWNLKTVVIPEGVTTIGEEAFSDCGELEKVKIPESIEEWGKNAFVNTQNINLVVYGGTPEKYESVIGEAEYFEWLERPFANAEILYETKDDVIPLPDTDTWYNGISITSKTMFRAVFEPFEMGVGYYDKETGSLLGVGFTSVDEGQDSASVSFKADNNCVDSLVKTFFWNNRQMLKPLASPIDTLVVERTEADKVFKTPHPYYDNMNLEDVYTYDGECESLTVVFNAESCTESNYDWVYVMDKDGVEYANISGSIGGYTVTVPGNTVRIRFTSDGSVCSYYGFETERIIINK